MTRIALRRLPLWAATTFVAASFAIVADRSGWDSLTTAVAGLGAFVVFVALVAAPWLADEFSSEREADPEEPSVEDLGISITTGRAEELWDEEFSLKARGLEPAEEQVGQVDYLAPTWALSFVTSFVASVEGRDPYMSGHSAEVAFYASKLAGAMQLPVSQQRMAMFAGMVHDIGMTRLPPDIASEAGPLDLEERRLLQTHSVHGEAIVQRVFAQDELSLAVRHHHERVDSYGYPEGLSGDEIPVVSRAIHIAEAYSAMTSERPHRDAMPARVAKMRLEQAAGSQFDPHMVDVFLALLSDLGDVSPFKARGVEQDAWGQYFELLALP